MTLLGIRFFDVPETIGWDGLVVFCRHLPDDSATMRAVHEHEHEGMEHWGTRNATNELLASLIDLVNYRFVRKEDRSKLSRVERPWESTSRHFGTESMSKEEFLDWYYGGDVSGQE